MASIPSTATTFEHRNFDVNSGNLIERVVFNHRWVFVLISVVLTVVLGWRAWHLEVNASFERMMPDSHEYIRNYQDNKAELAALGNTVRVMVENLDGDIFDPDYLQTLADINDRINLETGVDRAWMSSLWMPTVRWIEINETGLEGGTVMPSDYDRSQEKLQELKNNIIRANLLGNLVSYDMRSSMIVVPLMDKVAETGQPLDYRKFARFLDEIRTEYEPASGSVGDAASSPQVKIRIIGFAKLVGDLITGLTQVMQFFAAAVLIAALIVFAYTRCLRSTCLLLVTSFCSVIWLLGIMQLAGWDIDPYSILVPFLVFAIGMSHGAQKMNGIMQDVGRGVPRYIAARFTFRRLFIAGLTALLANVFGFAILMVIDIPVIRDLAITTSIGVCVLIFSQLLMVPVMLSFIGVSPKAASRSVRNDAGQDEQGGIFKTISTFLVNCTTPARARNLVIAAIIIGVGAFIVRGNIQVGDLDAGAPELRPESRYNQDIAFFNQSFGRSTDQFAVIVKTAQDECSAFETLTEMDRLTRILENLPGVQSVTSLSSAIRFVNSSYGEANPKWRSIPRDPMVSAQAASVAVQQLPELSNAACSVSPVIAYLEDHRAATLQRVVDTVEAFALEHNAQGRQFLLAAGTAGIEAATNIVVRQASLRVLLLLYASVVVLCLIAFRSWRAVLVALIPLVITSLLCEALMVMLGIGMKVATLPVIALGVGAGVDYALYLLSVQLNLQRRGASLAEAYGGALMFTGRIVALVGFTLATGVLTWIFSPIKFQVDMGILLTFMFLWNMCGALILIPALSHFLLRAESRTGQDQDTGDALTRPGAALAATVAK